MKKILIIISSLVLSVFFIACEEDGITDRSVDVSGGARLCYFNLSSGSSELNLYLNDVRVTSARSQVANVLRGIPYRSTYPGIITASPTATTLPTSYIGMEYFFNEAGSFSISVKDTAYVSGFTTYYTGDATFEDGKFYSLFTMNTAASMELVIAEDDIVTFFDTTLVKIRVVNALSNLTGGAVDVWMLHQPATGDSPIPPYKLADNLNFKSVTAFCDTITKGNYKWLVTIAGAVPTVNEPPVEATGKPYNLTFDGADLIYSRAATSVEAGMTYSLMVFGEYGSTGLKGPFSGLFRNRYK